MNPPDYLTLVKMFIDLCPEVIDCRILREEIQLTKGLWRYRLTLKNQSLLKMFEFFEIQSGQVKIIKYRFHWQKDDGQLIKRWDNAPHHPEIQTYPNHLHDGAEDSVFPYQPVGVKESKSMLLSINL